MLKNVTYNLGDTKRLRLLKKLNLMKNSTEAAYVNITDLAATICKTPIALFTVLSEQQQHFYAKTGTKINQTETSESFCIHALNYPEQRPFTIENTTEDANVKDSILVKNEPHIRFYSGVVVAIDGFQIGTLCVLDQKPRTLSKTEEEGLIKLAQQIEQLLVLKQANLNIKKQKKSYTTLKQMVANSRIGIWEWNHDSKKLSLNATALDLLELADSEKFSEKMTPKEWLSLIHSDDRPQFAECVSEFKNESKNLKIDVRILTSSHKLKWVTLKGKADKQNAALLSGTLADITEQKNTSSHFNTITNNIPGAVFRFQQYPDGSNQLKMVSAGAEKLWGFKAEEAMANNNLIWDCYDLRDLPGHIESIDKSEKELSPWQHEWRYHHPDGSLRWHKGNGNPIRLSDGSTIWDSLILDITDQKEAEIKEKLIDKKYEILIENSADAFAIVGENGLVDYVSSSITNVLGYKQNELLGKNMYDFTHPDDIPPLTNKILEILASPGKTLKRETCRMLHKNGNWRWIEASATNLLHEPIINGIVDNFRDITEITELQLLYDEAAKQAHIGAWELHIEENTLFLSPSVADIFGLGYHKKKLELQAFYNLFESSELEKIKDLFQNTYEESNCDIELEIVTINDSKVKWIRFMGRSIFENKLCVKFLGSIQDISSRKLAEKRFHNTVNNIPGLIFQYYLYPDGSDKITLLNEGSIDIWELNAEDVMNNSMLVWQQIHPEDLEETKISIEKSAKELSQWHHQWRIQCNSGQTKWIEGHGIPKRLPDGTVYWDTVLFDISDKKELEILLKDSAEMALIGSWEVDFSSGENPQIYCSPVTCNIIEAEHGYSPSFEEGFEIYEDETRETVKKAVFDLIKKGIPYTLEMRIKTKKGNIKWVRSMGKAEISQNICTRIYGCLQDIDKEKNYQIELSKKNQFLSTISQVISLFLQIENWFVTLEKVFKLIGNTVDVHRINYFVVHDDEKGIPRLCSQRIEWTADQISPQINNPDFQNIPIDAFENYFKPLKEGHYYKALTDDIEEGAFKESLRYQQVKSFLLMPLLVNNKFYGFIGFDDCKEARHWSESEIYFFKDISTNLSFAIARKNDKNALINAYSEVKTTLESIQDGFYALDKNWIVTYWNKKAEKLLLTKREDVLGKNLWDTFKTARKLKFFEKYNQALEEQIPVHFEEYFEPTKGWYDVSAFPSETGLTVYFKDITDKKQAEQELIKYQNIIENAQDGIALANKEGKALYLSPSFEKQLGYTVEKLNINGGPASVYSDKKVAQLVFGELLSGNTWQGDVDLISSKNQTLQYNLRGGPIYNSTNELIAVYGIHTDITERKNYEESLKQLNKSLEIRTKELIHINAELEQFAYVTSHDLQEPLRMVTSFLTQLNKKYGHALDEKAQQYIHYAVDGSKRMRQIILDLLEFSKIGKNTDKLESVNLNEIINEVEQLNRKLILEKNATIIYKNLPTITSFRSPMIQIFQNLINNSLKFSLPNTSALIEISCKTYSKYYIISIKDNGIGISEEYFDKIFIIFQRLHSKESFGGGTGMGLSIVKKIVDYLNGSINVESVENKGTTFTIKLPKN